MGDPECQTILPRLKTDLTEIFLACYDGRLNEINIDWKNKKSLCVVLCSKGYPDKFDKNIEIPNLNNFILKKDEYLFHAGTKIINNKIFSNGGRVLSLVSISEDFLDARKKIHKTLDNLNWNEGFFRKDIGYKVIDK